MLSRFTYSAICANARERDLGVFPKKGMRLMDALVLWLWDSRKLLLLLAALPFLFPMLRTPAFARGQNVICPSSFAVCLWLVIVSLAIALTPEAQIGGDKVNYTGTFESFAYNLQDWRDAGKDRLFYAYTVAVSTFTKSAPLYFVITAGLYVAGYAIAFRRIAREYWTVLMLAGVFAIGFFAYGDNTLRAGLAYSLLLCGISCFPKKLPFLLIAAVSFGIHHSMVIPIAACIIAFFYKNTRIIFAGWVVLLLISIIAGNATQEVLANTFADAEDQRLASYATGNSIIYKQGFRVDFLLYGFVPIAFGLYYVFRKHFAEPFYVWILNVYIITNGFWLLMIRAIFTDRFAYLSWGLIPIILFYPLLKKRIWSNQNFCIAGGIFGLFCIDLLLGFRDLLSTLF